MRLFLLVLGSCLFFLLLKSPVKTPGTTAAVVTQDSIETDLFDEAVACIKQFEGWHTAKHYPYIGYGHKVNSSESYNANISEQTADSLLRVDLKQKCVLFRSFGKDSLLLGVLAYNVGEYTLLGFSSKPKSTLIKKLEQGNRDIFEEYVSYRKCKNKVLPQLEKRRRYEYDLLFDKTKRISK